MVRPQVHSEKHYVQKSLFNVISPAVNDTAIVDAVEVSDKDAVNEVREGSIVKAVYIEMWLKAGEASNAGFFIASLYKAPAGLGAFTSAELSSMGGTANKKNVLFFTQGLDNDISGSATNIMRGWYKIPKSKQRFGLGDQLFLSISAPAIDVNGCGFMTYKEYF